MNINQVKDTKDEEIKIEDTSSKISKKASM